MIFDSLIDRLIGTFHFGIFLSSRPEEDDVDDDEDSPLNRYVHVEKNRFDFVSHDCRRRHRSSASLRLMSFERASASSHLLLSKFAFGNFVSLSPLSPRISSLLINADF